MGVVFTFVMGLLMSLQPITDPDVFWHIVIGQWIDVNKAIPTKELFSWYATSNNYEWTSHEWLTEWIMYKVGPFGCIILMLLIFLVLYYLMYKMIKVNAKKLLDFKWIYLLMMTVFFKVTNPRPYVISLLFFAYLIYVLLSYLDDGKPLFKKLIWTIPIVQILWVNLHGGSSSLPYVFIIGILLSDIFLRILPFKIKRWGDHLLSSDQRKTLLKLLLLVLVCSCINPVGYNILLYPFTNMADTNMIDMILEWNSPSFHGLLGIYIFIMVALPVFNMIVSEKKFKFYELALLLLMFYMCLKSQRFIGMYGIYSTWILGKYFFVTEDMYEKIRKPFVKFQKIITVSFVILLFLLMGFVGYKQIKNFKVIDNDGYYSDEGIDRLISLQPKRMYNDFEQGGYLLYKLSEKKVLDDVQIFSYGLGDVFSDNILIDGSKFAALKVDPDIIIDKYNFDVIITVSRSPIRRYLDISDQYEKVFESDMECIYNKVESNS